MVYIIKFNQSSSSAVQASQCPLLEWRWTVRQVDILMPWLIHFTYLSHWITNSYTSICNFALPIKTFFLNTQTHTHYHCSTVLWAAGQYVVVVRAPVDIKDRSGVADHHWVVLVHSTCLQHAAAETHSSHSEKSVKNSCEHWIAGQKIL